MKRLLPVFLVVSLQVSAQSLFLCNPMQGATTDSTARLWMEVASQVQNVEVKCSDNTKVVFKGIYNLPADSGHSFRPLTADIDNLKPGKRYTFQLTAHTLDKNDTVSGQLKNAASNTWQRQEPNKTFSFITGSCALLDGAWHPTAVLYKGDTSIFYRMAHTPSDFMLWLGDNWYTGKGEYETENGLLTKAHWTRISPVMQILQSSMPHYAIWDDHDYGPDNAGTSYKLKNETRGIFMKYWPNPSYGENDNGIYTKFNHNGIAFFLMDDRTWRSGEKNISYLRYFSKRMYGKQQMEWLKRSLLESRDAPFKIIATGTQVLAHRANRDCMRRFPKDFKELMHFIADNHINGVVFLTGDRHFSEIVKEERKGHYPLYDITISAFSSPPDKAFPREKRSKRLVPGTLYEDNNFARITITDGRQLHVDIINTKGQTVGQFQLDASQLTD